MKPNILRITPDYSPPETIGHWVGSRVNPFLDDYTHIAIVDRDVIVDDTFFELPERMSDCDIITVRVVPSSVIFEIWELLTFWLRLEKKRLRGCACIYSTRFLKRIGGYPENSLTPDTWLYQKSRWTYQHPIIAKHLQPFNLRHSIRIQIRTGQSRAETHYSFWKTLAHSIIRARPFVIAAYLYYRYRGRRTEFGHPW